MKPTDGAGGDEDAHEGSSDVDDSVADSALGDIGGDCTCVCGVIDPLACVGSGDTRCGVASVGGASTSVACMAVANGGSECGSTAGACAVVGVLRAASLAEATCDSASEAGMAGAAAGTKCGSEAGVDR